MTSQVVGYILNESNISEAELRSVERKKNGVVKMVAVLQEANLLNRNGRSYPKDVIARALETPYVVEKLKTCSFLGESNHPANADVQRQVSIDLNNVSHVIKKVYWDEKDPNLLLGEVETASTEIGKNFAGLISENGMQASFSMRGLGDVIKDPKGFLKVKDPLRIVSYDSVSYPSHQKAYMRNIVNENAMIPIQAQQLAKYAADNSKNFQQLNEEILCIARDSLDFQLTEGGQLKVTDRRDGKQKAIMLLETSIKNEVRAAMRSLF